MLSIMINFKYPPVYVVLSFSKQVCLCVRVFFDLVDVVVLKFSVQFVSRMDGVGL